MELLITTREELTSVVQSAISDLVKQKPQKVIEKTWLPLVDALELINSNGIKLKKSTMYVLVHRGEIPYHKFGQTTLFDKNELMDWIAAKPARGSKFREGQNAVIKSAQRRLVGKN